MTGRLYRLGHLSARHRWKVLAAWLVVFAALAVWARSAGPDLTDNLTLPGTDSQRATALLTERFPSQANGTTPVVMQAPHGTKLTDATYRQPIDATVSALRKDADVRSATSPLSSDGRAFLSKDGTVGYIAVNVRPSTSDLTQDDAQRIVDETRPADAAGLHVGVGSYVGQKVSKPETHSSEAVGLGVAVVVLLLTFGTVVAMGMPIVTAVVGLVSGLSIITLLSHVFQVPTVAPTLATMIGLGVGIDYALFIVTRHQEQRREGMETAESIARAIATSGGAVLFAGSIVVVALVSLAVVDIPLVTTLGLTSALVVVVAVLAALTLLPAVLGIAGDRIDMLRVPHPPPAPAGQPHGWTRWGGFVARNPIPAAGAAVAVLAALAVPALDIYLGQQDNGALPTDTQARKAYDGMTKGFGVGSNGPFLVAVDLTRKPATGAQPAADPRLQGLRKDLQGTAGVQSTTQPLVNSGGTAAVYTLTPATAPSDRATSDLVGRLRDDTIPAATRGADMSANIGGTTAGYVDLASEISSRLIITIAVVVALSFLLLVAAFRSIVIPATAGLMNLISIGAAFGVVTAVFEKGWGIGVVGLDDEVPIVSFVPLMMFAILFGLSMDYEVFLMTHVREAWRAGSDTTRAVVAGIGTTGRVITSAALIMVSVFLAFVINGDPTVKQFGVGMAVAVAVDATLVRCLLVPAVMVLLGRANWWFPRALERAVPNVSIEGDEWFRARDAAERERERERDRERERAPTPQAGGGARPETPPAPGTTTNARTRRASEQRRAKGT